jgi:hypothetical protein
LKRKVDEIVEQYTKNESKEYCKRIQEIIQEFKPRINARRDDEGKLLTEKEDIEIRWKENSESVFTGNQMTQKA